MSSSDNVMTCADMVTRVFTNIEREDLENSNKIFSAWRTTVETVKPNGRNIAAHSKVIDFKNGILLVEADHPGWIQLMQLHQRYILTGLNRKVPDMHIGSLAFRLSGSSAFLSDAGEKYAVSRERERLSKQLDREQEELTRRGFGADRLATENGGEKRELPPELKTVFERLKSEMKNGQNG